MHQYQISDVQDDADADLLNFLDQWTDNGSLLKESCRCGLMRIIFLHFLSENFIS